MGPRESVGLAGFLGKKAGGGGAGGGRKKVVCGLAQVKAELPTHCLRGLEQAFSIHVCCSSSEE